MVMAPIGRDDRSTGGAQRATAKPKTLQLGETTPERLEVEINGKHLKAWVVKNQRFPVSVAAELEDARQRYRDSQERIWDGPPPPEAIDVLRELVALGDADNVPSTGSLGPLVEAAREVVKGYEAQPQYRTSMVNWEAYVTTCLTILIPHLEDWEADMLPTDVRHRVLVELGWFNPLPGEQETEEEADPTSPPVAGASSTGAEPAPDSPASTA